jgi:hypothetical protein
MGMPRFDGFIAKTRPNPCLVVPKPAGWQKTRLSNSISFQSTRTVQRTGPAQNVSPQRREPPKPINRRFLSAKLGHTLAGKTVARKAPIFPENATPALGFPNPTPSSLKLG